MVLSYHPYLPFCWKIISSRAPWLHEPYLVSSLLRTHPPPSHLQFTSRLSVREPTLLQRISSWDEQGFSSCLVSPKVSCHHYHPAEVFIRFSPFSIWTCCLRPTAAGSTFEAIHFRGHLCVRLHYDLLLRPHPKGEFVGRLQRLDHSPCCYPSYRFWTFNLAGLTPAEHTSLCWTHNRTWNSRFIRLL